MEKLDFVLIDKTSKSRRVSSFYDAQKASRRCIAIFLHLQNLLFLRQLWRAAADFASRLKIANLQGRLVAAAAATAAWAEMAAGVTDICQLIQQREGGPTRLDSGQQLFLSIFKLL